MKDERITTSHKQSARAPRRATPPVRSALEALITKHEALGYQILVISVNMLAPQHPNLPIACCRTFDNNGGGEEGRPTAAPNPPEPEPEPSPYIMTTTNAPLLMRKTTAPNKFSRGSKRRKNASGVIHYRRQTRQMQTKRKCATLRGLRTHPPRRRNNCCGSSQTKLALYLPGASSYFDVILLQQR